MIRPLSLSLLLATPAFAQNEGRGDFIAANMLAIFYHELGHGLIDVVGLPVLGREEDAADALSVLMINGAWDEETATKFSLLTTKAFRLYAAETEATGEPPLYWDTHSLDMQRYYNHVCLFYGAEPERRANLVTELDSPEGRAAEYELTSASWGAMLEDLEPGRNPYGLRMADAVNPDPWVPLIIDEVADLNKTYSLPAEITVSVESCGEINAFYDPERRRISLCTEYAEDLGRLYDENQ